MANADAARCLTGYLERDAPRFASHGGVSKEAETFDSMRTCGVTAVIYLKICLGREGPSLKPLLETGPDTLVNLGRSM